MTNRENLMNMTNAQIARILPKFCDSCEIVFGGDDCQCVRCLYDCEDCYEAREKYLEDTCEEN